MTKLNFWSIVRTVFCAVVIKCSILFFCNQLLFSMQLLYCKDGLSLLHVLVLFQCADLFTHTIWACFLHLTVQHTETRKFQQKKMIVKIYRHVLHFVSLPVQNMPSLGFWVACVYVLQPLATIVSVYVLCFVLYQYWILRACISTARYKGSLFFVFLEAVLQLFSDYFAWKQKEIKIL